MQLLLAIALAAMACSAANAAPPVPLFGEGFVPGQPSGRAKAGREKLTRVDPTALWADSITISLFDGDVVALKDRTKTGGHGGLSWEGHLEGDAFSEVVLVRHKGKVAGTVTMSSGEVYEIQPSGDSDMYEILEVDQSLLPEHSPDNRDDIDPAEHGIVTTEGNVAVRRRGLLGLGGRRALSHGSDPSTEVDLVLFYTAASRARYGEAGVESKVLAAVASANAAYTASNVNFQLNVLYLGEIPDFAESPNGMGTTLPNFAQSSYVNAMRNKYGADAAALISEDTNYCGIAYVMTHTGFNYPFSVTYSGCLSGGTFAHEVGHNMGNAHDEANSNVLGLYPEYSFGYKVEGTFRTTMSYGCSVQYCPRINRFSNPDLSYNGLPTGVAYTGSGTGADNARSMNQAAGYISNWRRKNHDLAAPSAPSAVAASPASSTAAAISWSGGSGEDAFAVQRSDDGGATWDDVADVPYYTTAVTDTPPPAPSTTYAYRVRAYNYLGASPWSAAAQVTLVGTSTPAPVTASPTASPTASQIGRAHV